MSMIGSLIDELNKSADEWNGSNMFELARMCREAADTIWQLRDDLQRTNDAVRDAEHDESRAWDRVRKAEAENAKLVDVLHEVEDEAVLAFNSLRQDCETITDSLQYFFEKWWRSECEVDRLKAENAKLREQVKEMHVCLEDECKRCHEWGDTCDLEHQMRELGVEVVDA